MRVADSLISLAGVLIAYLSLAGTRGWWPLKRRRAPVKLPLGSRLEPGAGRARRRRFRLPGEAMALGLLGVLAGLGIGYLGLARANCWRPFPSCHPVRIDTAASMFRPQAGRDPAREYVCLVNKTDERVDLQGWVLRDSHRDVNVLPEFSLPAKGHVRVHPGRGHDSRTDLFGDSGRPVWNNTGDTVTLVDRDGDEIDSRSYAQRPRNDSTATCG